MLPTNCDVGKTDGKNEIHFDSLMLWQFSLSSDYYFGDRNRVFSKRGVFTNNQNHE